VDGRDREEEDRRLGRTREGDRRAGDRGPVASRRKETRSRDPHGRQDGCGRRESPRGGGAWGRA
jgi:hypothetical protein